MKKILQDKIWDMFWHSDSNDVELLWEYKLVIRTKAADVHSPIRRMKIQKNSPHWMCKEIIAEIFQKDFLKTNALGLDDIEDWFKF